jgi:hypothetical protein
MSNDTVVQSAADVLIPASGGSAAVATKSAA